MPEERLSSRSKTPSWPWSCWAGPGVQGHLKAGWVAGDDAFGMSPSFRESLARMGMRYVLDVPGSTPVWPLGWLGPVRGLRGPGAPASPGSGTGSVVPWSSAVAKLPDKAWREITVAQGKPGTAELYVLRPDRVRVTRKGKTGPPWAVYRRNLDGSESPYHLSNAAEDTPLETLAYVGGSSRAH